MFKRIHSNKNSESEIKNYQQRVFENIEAVSQNGKIMELFEKRK